MDGLRDDQEMLEIHLDDLNNKKRPAADEEK